eukprot:730471-Prymnesium_polylepis.1
MRFDVRSASCGGAGAGAARRRRRAAGSAPLHVGAPVHHLAHPRRLVQSGLARQPARGARA